MASDSSPKKIRVDRRRRTARAEQRDARQEILEAAAEVFVARGFHGASVDEVANEAGYSKGAIYWHFEGKADLFLALIEERVDGPTREMVKLLESAPASQDLAPEASRRFAELLSQQREWLVLDHEYWLRAVRDPDLGNRFAESRRKLRGALGKALAARVKVLGPHQFVGDPEHVASAIMALNTGFAQQALLDPQAIPAELFGDTILLIYKGLLTRAGESREAPAVNIAPDADLG